MEERFKEKDLVGKIDEEREKRGKKKKEGNKRQTNKHISKHETQSYKQRAKETDMTNYWLHDYALRGSE